MDMYCPTCTIVLPATAQRCTQCGNVATLAPGTIVQGIVNLYEIDSVLGIGGMGIVYKARSSSGPQVVVKELYAEDPADLPDAQRRFKREADIQALISHQAFPAGYGYFVDPNLGTHEFMAMEFVEGDDLGKTLNKHPNKRMDEAEVLQLGIQICDGLDVLHNFVDPATGQLDPIIHRDIKPANIILTPSGQVKILDLGIARTVRQSAGTAARATRAGTYEYASPQIVSGVDISVRDDIYALAATLFHLYLGHPFVGDFTQRAQEIDQLSPTWQPIFRRAIQNDSNLRQRSATEFKTDLIQLLPLHLRPVAVTPQPQLVIQPLYAQTLIRWQQTSPAMINPGEYRQIIAGQVIQGGAGLAGAKITIPLISDTGGKGVALTAGLHGDFSINLTDSTVPVAVKERQLTIVVEDAGTGAELYREIFMINRPAGASVKRIGLGIAGALASPFKAFGQWRQQRQLAKAPIIQAKAQAYQARQQAKAQAYQAKQQAKLAKQQAKAQAKAAQQAAKAQAAQQAAQAGPAKQARTALLLSILFFLVFLAAAIMHKRTEWNWLMFIWYNALALSFCFARLWKNLKAGRTPRLALRKSFITLLTLFFWIVPMLGIIIRTLAG